MRAISLAALGVFAALAATPAPAAIMSATYSGIITSGDDPDGIFGISRSGIIGESFSMNFVYDSLLGIHQFNGGGDQQFGGSASSAGQPLLSASFTLGATTLLQTGDANGDFYSSIAWVVPGYGLISPSHHSGAGLACHNGGQQGAPYFGACIITRDAIPDDLDTPFSVVADRDDPETAQVQVLGDTNPWGYHLIEGRTQRLVVTKLGESPGSGGAVPEPATWSMLILGFGAAGAGLRSRRKGRALA